MSSRRTVPPSQGEKAQGVHTLHALLDVGVQHLCVGLQNLDVGMERFSPYQTPALGIGCGKKGVVIRREESGAEMAKTTEFTGPPAVSHKRSLEAVSEDRVGTVIPEKLRIFTCCQITDVLGAEVVRFIEDNHTRFSGVEVIRATPPFNRKYIDGDDKLGIVPINDVIKTTVEGLGGNVIDLDVPSFGFEPFDALRTLVDGDPTYEDNINGMCRELGIPIPMRIAAVLNKTILKSAVGPDDFRIQDLANFLHTQTEKGFDDNKLEQRDLDSALLVKEKLMNLHNKIVEMRDVGVPKYEEWIEYLQNHIIAQTHESTWREAENLDFMKVAKLLGLTENAQRYHISQEEGVNPTGKDRDGKKPYKADIWLAKVLIDLVTIPSYCLDAVAFASAVADNISVTEMVYDHLPKLQGNVKSAAVFHELSTTISNILKGEKEARIEKRSLWLPHLHVVDLEMDDGFSMLLHTALLRAFNKDNSVPSFMVQLPLVDPINPIIKAISDEMLGKDGWIVVHDKKSLNIDKILTYYKGHSEPEAPKPRVS